MGALTTIRAVRLAGAPVVVLAVASVAFLRPFPSVTGNGSAMVGTGQVTHMVLEDSLGSYLLNLRTGSHTPVSGREEIWYRQGEGMFSRQTFRGAPAWETFLPARLVARETPLSAIFLATYGEQAAEHSFHVTHAGHLGKTPVFWIESTPRILGGPSRSEVEEVAISKASHMPLYSRLLMNGRVELGSGVRVLSIETTNSAPANLRATNPRFPLGPGYSFPGGYLALSLKEARTQYPALVIRSHIAGLRLVLVAQTPAATTGDSPNRFAGASFYYGSLLNSGLPNDREPDTSGLKPYVSVDEYTRNNALTRFLSAFFPPAGFALIDYLGHTNSSATLRRGGMSIVIKGSTDALVISASRALGR